MGSADSIMTTQWPSSGGWQAAAYRPPGAVNAHQLLLSSIQYNACAVPCTRTQTQIHKTNRNKHKYKYKYKYKHKYTYRPSGAVNEHQLLLSSIQYK